MSYLTLDQANTIVSTALAKGAELQLNPLTVVVLDAGGHYVALNRQDDSGIMRVEIATGKAWVSLGMGLPSRSLNERDNKFLTALAAASQGRAVPVPGGVLIRDPESGRVMGAVGVSGDVSEQDEACAIAGIEAAELKADSGL